MRNLQDKVYPRASLMASIILLVIEWSLGAKEFEGLAASESYWVWIAAVIIRGMSSEL